MWHSTPTWKRSELPVIPLTRGASREPSAHRNAPVHHCKNDCNCPPARGATHMHLCRPLPRRREGALAPAETGPPRQLPASLPLSVQGTQGPPLQPLQHVRKRHDNHCSAGRFSLPPLSCAGCSGALATPLGQPPRPPPRVAPPRRPPPPSQAETGPAPRAGLRPRVPFGRGDESRACSGAAAHARSPAAAPADDAADGEGAAAAGPAGPPGAGGARALPAAGRALLQRPLPGGLHPR